MKRNVYEVRREPGRIVAAEIGDDAAAVLFSAGRSILLATEQELIQLGRRERRVITILGRGTTSHSPGTHATVVVLQEPQAARASGCTFSAEPAAHAGPGSEIHVLEAVGKTYHRRHLDARVSSTCG